MDKEVKNAINREILQSNSKRYFSDKSILMPNNTRPKPSTLWHMQHIPYKAQDRGGKNENEEDVLQRSRNNG